MHGCCQTPRYSILVRTNRSPRLSTKRSEYDQMSSTLLFLIKKQSEDQPRTQHPSCCDTQQRGQRTEAAIARANCEATLSALVPCRNLGAKPKRATFTGLSPLSSVSDLDSLSTLSPTFRYRARVDHCDRQKPTSKYVAQRGSCSWFVI